MCHWFTQRGLRISGGVVFSHRSVMLTWGIGIIQTTSLAHIYGPQNQPWRCIVFILSLPLGIFLGIIEVSFVEWVIQKVRFRKH